MRRLVASTKRAHIATVNTPQRPETRDRYRTVVESSAMALKRPAEHEIGDAGERLFQAQIPHAWHAQKFERDYGIDFIVAVPEAHLVTEVRFGAQVKATRTSFPRTGSSLRLVIETAHLQHWLDVETMPVFLIAVEVEPTRVHYVDVDVLEPPARWREQQTVTVRVPEANLVRESSFVDAVRIAWARRSSPAAALKRRKRELEAVDPRFRVHLKVDDDGEHRTLIPLCDVTGKLVFRDTLAVRSKVKELEEGYTVSFEAGEVHVEGLPLLESIKNGARVQVGSTMPSGVTVDARSSHGIAIVANIPAKTIMAPAIVRIEGELGPLRVRCRLPRLGARLIGPITVTTDFDGRRWAGVRLLQLAHFETLRNFANVVASGATIGTTINIPGEPCRLGEHAVDPACFLDVRWFVELVALARKVATIADVNPKTPSSFTVKREEEVRRAHALLTSGEYRADGRPYSFTLRLPSPPSATDGDLDVVMRQPVVEKLPFLGTSIAIRTSRVTLTRAIISPGRALPDGTREYVCTTADGELIHRIER